MNATFCPQCGTPRVGSFRFCHQCRFDFETAPVAAGLTGQSASPLLEPPGPNTTATFAGVAWLAAAAVTGFLAFQQWDAGATLTRLGLADEGLGANAAWNAVGAVITAYFGARCLRNPDKGFLSTSAGWGVVNVAWGAYQVANGATYWIFYVILVASGLAGVLSFAARGSAPASRRVKS